MWQKFLANLVVSILGSLVNSAKNNLCEADIKPIEKAIEKKILEVL